MALFRKNIEWADMNKNQMVYKYPLKNSGREINRKSTLTVRESQLAIFVHKGEIADIFLPGLYKLDTEILPILTKLASWKYSFETPITLDIYFINTTQFTGCKWGTQNPFIMRDPEFGTVRVRGFGTYAFRVDQDNADKFLKELFGTASSFTTEEIMEYLKSMLISYISDAIGESKLSVVDLAGNTVEFNTIVKAKVQAKFAEIGLILTNLVIENMSVPKDVEEALDQRTKLGIYSDKTDVLLKVAAAEAMKDAAKNPSNPMASGGVGLGAGVGMGAFMADAFRGAMATPTATPTPTATATPTVAPVAVATAGTMVCPSCAKAIPDSVKFCPECGASCAAKFCSNCGTKLSAGDKFCSNCGTKV